ncbi:adenylosuccinate synthetase [Secundilactobacillus oryzae JCM 18671]|uniref:Adenylosuccinate synthetase n=1 Tax=Secundilactobacillus oryzae JCM 18671 TaxID=1291743 RepID=A0A081BGX0_9LACO|nr:adenylosuccinate synthase [Secundilactobacillus oryzae]GAK47288.1 adenylosuccinate synthetase [Secundilactobacillus oryzae JCM 18671]
MSSIVVVGSQWGDEGKGKITDFLSQKADIVARYAGGNNAGHTIVFNGEKFQLQLIPSGIFFSEKLSVIGNGVVVNPGALVQEIKGLNDKGVSTDNLRISDRAQVLLPYHIWMDELQEAAKTNKIGTTKNGIGPAYMDKAERIGIRMADLLDKDVFETKLRQNLELKNRIFTKLYDHEPMDFDAVFEETFAFGQELKRYVTDTSVIINDALAANKHVLFEGAQGVMLDLDHGTYPFVTSSNPVAGGAATGTGVGPTLIDDVVGVCKAYTSRVGDGPFPTELFDETGDFIREVGHEYGTVTGRPRRIGWFDSVVMRHAVRASGLTYLSLNCLDVLTGIKELKIAIRYELNGKTIENYPASLVDLNNAKPVYETMPGWDEDITGITKLEDLPENARNYLLRLEELVGAKIATFSVGPDRDQTNILTDIWDAQSN